MNSRTFDHVTPLLRQLNWLPVRQLLYYRDCVLNYQCFNGLAPKYLVDKFTMSATPAIATYYLYHCIELPLVNAHSHIEELVFGKI